MISSNLLNDILPTVGVFIFLGDLNAKSLALGCKSINPGSTLLESALSNNDNVLLICTPAIASITSAVTVLTDQLMAVNMRRSSSSHSGTKVPSPLAAAKPPAPSTTTRPTRVSSQTNSTASGSAQAAEMSTLPATASTTLSSQQLRQRFQAARVLGAATVSRFTFTHSSKSARMCESSQWKTARSSLPSTHWHRRSERLYQRTRLLLHILFIFFLEFLL